MPHTIQRVLLCTCFLLVGTMNADSWKVAAGAESSDKGTQVIAFLPNEIWIHAGDAVTWSFPSDEPHSVTFLKPLQPRPSFAVGCSPTITTPDGSSFDGSTCLNSGLIMIPGSTYTVLFPAPGNYLFVCLLHVNMTGVVHVLDSSQPLPHDQEFYDRQAALQQHDLLSDHDGRVGRRAADGAHFADHLHGGHVITGTGEIVSTTGGLQSVSRMRFMQPSITVHAGETVEWDSSDVSGHSVTFGQEPPNVSPLTPPIASAGVLLFADPDGALHAILNSPSDSVHSGRIAPGPQERTAVAQAPPGATRFRVTFATPGTYPYICAFHDGLGMKGEVIVLP